MRDTRLWSKYLAKELRRNWPDEATISVGHATESCEVELGLLLSRFNELKAEKQDLEKGENFWALLQGYDFGFPPQLASEIATVRHLLLHFRSPSAWINALNRYRQCPEHLRGFEMDDCGVWHRRIVTLEHKRFSLYEKTLVSGAPHRAVKTRWAQAGDYRFRLGEFQTSVYITEDLCFAPPQAHQFGTRTTNAPIFILWEHLLAIAQWMDATENVRPLPSGEGRGNWFARLEHVQLYLRDAKGVNLVKVEALNIDGLLHLAGMVSSGKSTLMKVLAIHCIRQGRRVTLVLADVIDVLRRAALFSRLVLTVAPILGATGRESHLTVITYDLRDHGLSDKPTKAAAYNDGRR